MANNIDKFTRLIDSINRAASEIEKQSLDLNNNGINVEHTKDGIELKKSDKPNEAEEELTAGQKSLVWESADKKSALANHLGVKPEAIEEENGFLTVGDKTYKVFSKEEMIDEAVYETMYDIKNKVWKLADTMELSDFIEECCEWEDGYLVASSKRIAEAIVDKGLFDYTEYPEVDGFYIKEI